jgi:hypothetical protein
MVADLELQAVLIAAIVVLAAYLVLLVVRLSRLQVQARASQAPPGPPVAAGETAPAHGGDAAVAAPDTAAAPVPNLTIPAAAPKPPPRRVSPVHEKAAALAREGHDAATVARLCGISQSEAELVCWLARNRDPA